MAKKKRKPELITIPLQEFESLVDKHKNQMNELQAERDACEQLRERYARMKDEAVKWIGVLKSTNDNIAKKENALAQLMDDAFYDKL